MQWEMTGRYVSCKETWTPGGVLIFDKTHSFRSFPIPSRTCLARLCNSLKAANFDKTVQCSSIVPRGATPLSLYILQRARVH